MQGHLNACGWRIKNIVTLALDLSQHFFCQVEASLRKVACARGDQKIIVSCFFWQASLHAQNISDSIAVSSYMQ